MLAGALRGPGDVEHVVEQLEREPDRAPEAAQQVLGAAAERAEPARGLEQPRGLEVAAAVVALAADRRVPRVLALEQLALRERRGGVGEQPHGLRAPARGELRERAREQQVAGRGRHRAPGHRDHRRAPAAQRRRVEHVVVHERGRVHQLHGHRAPQHRVGVARLGPGGHEHEQRPQPLAAGGDRRAGVLGQHGAVGARELGQARLEALHQLRDVRAAGLDDRGDRLGAGHQALVPECRAMIPPAVRIQRTSTSPAAAITPPSSLGPGKRLTELGRYV